MRAITVSDECQSGNKLNRSNSEDDPCQNLNTLGDRSIWTFWIGVFTQDSTCSKYHHWIGQKEITFLLILYTKLNENQPGYCVSV